MSRGRSLRLVPLVVMAAASLFVLKAFALFLAGTDSFGSGQPAFAQGSEKPAEPTGSRGKGDREKSWMQEVFDYPQYTGAVPAPDEKTSPPPAVGAKPVPAPAPAGAAPAGEVKPKSREPATPPREVKPAGAPGFDPEHPPPSAGERAVLESLNQRRQELEARARELDVRENLLAATEKRVQARLAEIREAEARINATVHKKDEAEAARFKSLVSMYENMKAKDAAKIFDRLDMRVLLELSAQINPRRMSDILALMSPEVAERLTGEIAARAGAVEKPAAAPDLPKIEGRPSGG
jgi:flagellar motility protein MotE (MotC chaperone)